MNNAIWKGFLARAKAVYSRFELDFLVLGNWYDAVGFIFDGIPASVPSAVIERQKQLIDAVKAGTVVLQASE